MFGWTADPETSFAVLDAFRAAGEMVIATKVGMATARPGLGGDNIAAACEDSLRRLGTDYIDLYYAHQDDPDTPQEETLDAFAAVALARLAAQPAVVASIASARSVDQLPSLTAMAQLKLSDEELARLDRASRQIQA